MDRSPRQGHPRGVSGPIDTHRHARTPPDETDGPTASARSARSAGLRLAVLAAALVALGATAFGVAPDVEQIRGLVAGAGWIAPAAFVLLYAVLTVALVPASVLTVAAGLLFGPLAGTVLVVLGATAGSATAFRIARSAGRPSVTRLASGRVEAVDRWLQDRGLLAVITLRLVPVVPFSASNYAAGLTGITVRDFVLGTAIGIIPGSLAYTVLGARFATPTDPVFLVAMAGLAALTIGGSVLLRRSNRSRDDTP